MCKKNKSNNPPYSKTKGLPVSNIGKYVVFEIVEGFCHYTRLNLLTAEKAYTAALNILLRSQRESPDTEAEYDRRVRSINKLQSVDLDNAVTLMILPVEDQINNTDRE